MFVISTNLYIEYEFVWGSGDPHNPDERPATNICVKKKTSKEWNIKNIFLYHLL